MFEAEGRIGPLTNVLGVGRFFVDVILWVWISSPWHLPGQVQATGRSYPLFFVRFIFWVHFFVMELKLLPPYILLDAINSHGINFFKMNHILHLKFYPVS